MGLLLWRWPYDHNGTEKWAEHQRRIADDSGITIRQTHGYTLTGLQWDDPVCEYQPTFIERSIRCIRASKILGAQWVVVHPTNLPHAPLYIAKEAKDANLTYLAPLIEEAKKQGIGWLLKI